MYETIMGAVISLVTWLVDRSQKAKLSAAKYVDYIQKWIKNTPTGAEVSDEHDELMNTKVDDEKNV